MESENPLLQLTLNGLRSECPEIWLLAQRWLETPHCWRLVHILLSTPHQWLGVSDLAGRLGQEEEETQVALSCLLEQELIIALKVPEVEVTFYRLTDHEPEQEMMARFRAWCQGWRARLEAIHELLGVGWH